MSKKRMKQVGEALTWWQANKESVPVIFLDGLQAKAEELQEELVNMAVCLETGKRRGRKPKTEVAEFTEQ